MFRLFLRGNIFLGFQGYSFLCYIQSILVGFFFVVSVQEGGLVWWFFFVDVFQFRFLIEVRLCRVSKQFVVELNVLVFCDFGDQVLSLLVVRQGSFRMFLGVSLRRGFQKRFFRIFYKIQFLRVFGIIFFYFSMQLSLKWIWVGCVDCLLRFIFGFYFF